jgi:hypothetical protein
VKTNAVSFYYQIVKFLIYEKNLWVLTDKKLRSIKNFDYFLGSIKVLQKIRSLVEDSGKLKKGHKKVRKLSFLLKFYAIF